MSGNAIEWVNDLYEDYSSESATNPTGALTGSKRVYRGGCWSDRTCGCRTAYRTGVPPTGSAPGFGFRVVLRPKGAIPDTHTINGRVLIYDSSFMGVTVTMDGETTTTGSDGTYSFTGLPDGTYTITFDKSGYTFSPSSKEVTVSGSDVTADDVTATRSGGDIPKDITLVSIPGGTFEMGDEDGFLWYGCRPVHTVTVSDFNMSTTEITYAQYATYLNEALAWGDINEPSGGSVTCKTGEYSGQEYIYLSGSLSSYPQIECWISYNNGTFSVKSGYENWPVVWVTWYGAKAFALYYGLDLPREAEWEYAARGGKQYKYGTDDGTISTSKANYDQNIGYPVDVGSYPANPFGLYDMCGNVNEWCNDWYDCYNSDSVINPTGALNGSKKTKRGGSWYHDAPSCRTAQRGLNLRSLRGITLGFRVVRRHTPDTHTINGRVLFNDSSFMGVTVTMDGETTFTGSDGAYSFTGLPDGTYTITFAKSGYTFSLSSKEVTVSGSDVTADDVTATRSGGGDIPKDITFVSIPGGTFEMGDEYGHLWYGCRPVHTVTVSDFEMSTTEITNAQYAAYLNEALASGDINEPSGGSVTGKTGDYSVQKYIYLSGSYSSYPQNECWIRYKDNTFVVESGNEKWPVVYVTWYGAKAFALYYGLDLPREAEWEYAARGGKQYKYGTDDGTISTSKANYLDTEIKHPVEVGSFFANPFGLKDMSGNVWEWCNDWYDGYSSDSAINPTGALTGSRRVIRGSSWDDIADYCRTPYRSLYAPDGRGDNVGFRVVRRSPSQNQ